ncbi:hypothetical protein [Paenibacillus sp. A3M_27_13]|uniref:hypothetical protein n=1 Tax=Paenibacillus sp. A3M_27_13 TaxID=2962029 RepID=UPI0020B704E6|nr:hypothetical protein [Paenibacillus sp. A3M_27_13]MCP3746622.1 hypothetical protein [Paenibacillus sp. A3M_27_13]
MSIRREVAEGIRDYKTAGLAEGFVLAELLFLGVVTGRWADRTWWPEGEWWVGAWVFIVCLLLLFVPVTCLIMTVVFGLACGMGCMIGDYLFENLGASVVIAIISGVLGLMVNMVGCPRFTSKRLAQEFIDKL